MKKMCLKNVSSYSLQMWFGFGDGDDGCNEDSGGDDDDRVMSVGMVVMTVVVRMMVVTGY